MSKKGDSSIAELMRAFMLRPHQVEPLIRRIACNPCKHGFPQSCYRVRRYGNQSRFCFDIIKEHLYQDSAYVAKLRLILGRSKAVPCLDCKKHKPDRMTYDHLPQFEKSFDIGKVGHGVYPSIKELIKEISKCQVVCRDCHDKREQVRQEAAKAEMLVLMQTLMPWFEIGRAVLRNAAQDKVKAENDRVMARMETLAPWFELSGIIRKRWQEPGVEWGRIIFEAAKRNEASNAS